MTRGYAGGRAAPGLRRLRFGHLYDAFPGRSTKLLALANWLVTAGVVSHMVMVRRSIMNISRGLPSAPTVGMRVTVAYDLALSFCS